MDITEYNQIITELYNGYMEDGFIAERESLSFSLFFAYNTPTNLIDSIIEQIHAMGIIIIEDEDYDSDQITDSSKSDYNEYYDEVIELVPELRSYIEYVRNAAPPQCREWEELLPQAQKGNIYARNRLIEMYSGVAVKQALYFSKKYHLSIEDALQDGLAGLITSIDKYNPVENTKFSTYFPWWVTQFITRYRWVNNNPTYFPENIKEKLFEVVIEIEEHYCENCPQNDKSTCKELIKIIGDKNGWSYDEAKKNIAYLPCWSSLDELKENNDIDDGGLFVEELNDKIEKDIYPKVIDAVLNTLAPREESIIKFRFGLTENGIMTLAEVGNIIDLSRERVRQIEAIAINKLRNPPRSKMLNG